MRSNILNRAWRAGLLCIGLAAATLATTAPARAAYPEKPLTWVVGFPPGGGTDFMARTIAAKLSELVGQPVVIDNRAGAGGNIAAGAVARGPADGYTLMSAERTLLTYSGSLFRKLPFDPYRDFKPVSLMASSPFLLVVGAAHPARDAAAFIASVKARPGQVSYGSPGLGTPHHIAAEFLSQAAGLSLLHVPYKGAAPAVTDLMGGQVEAMVLDLQIAQPLLRGGKIRALAVLSPQRLAQPEWQGIPSIAELGIRMVDATTWQGVVVPAGTPDAVVERLGAALRRAIESDEVRAQLVEAGLVPTASTPAGMAQRIAQDAGAWREDVARLGIVLD